MKAFGHRNFLVRSFYPTDRLSSAGLFSFQIQLTIPFHPRSPSEKQVSTFDNLSITTRTSIISFVLDVVVVEETIDLNSGAAHRVRNSVRFFVVIFLTDWFQSTNDSFPDRMRDALRRCLHFRYIHRLYEVKFADRFYPVTLQLVVNQSESEAIALNDYENDLNEFEQTVQRDCLVDAATCERMFNEYVSLQRNYHRMKKLMNIKTIGRTDPLRG